MGGVGSFNRQNRTLYIGRIKETRQTAEDVEDHFSEFGEIERSKAFHSRPSSSIEQGLNWVLDVLQLKSCRIEV